MRRYSIRTSAAFLALTLVAGWGCGDDGSPVGTPKIESVSPQDGASGVPRNTSVSAKFSEAMKSESLTTLSFVLISETSMTPIAGTVNYSKRYAIFWPSVPLSSLGAFTATITTNATSAEGVPLAASRSWMFTTADGLAAELPVTLGAAGDFVILAKSGISSVPMSAITGDVGVSPAAASYVTGFTLTADATNVFSTSAQVTGHVYAADYASPTPYDLATAIGDMELAFAEAAARAPTVTELGAGNIGGMVLAPGVYRWGTGLSIPADVTLIGSSSDVFVFQVAGDLTVASATQILLSGGVSARNVFWQVAGLVDLGSASHFEGVVLSKTAITLRTGASIHGRLLAQTAVTLDASTVVEP